MMAIINARRDTIRATKEIESEFKWRGILVVVDDEAGKSRGLGYISTYPFEADIRAIDITLGVKHGPFSNSKYKYG